MQWRRETQEQLSQQWILYIITFINLLIEYAIYFPCTWYTSWYFCGCYFVGRHSNSLGIWSLNLHLILNSRKVHQVFADPITHTALLINNLCICMFVLLFQHYKFSLDRVFELFPVSALMITIVWGIRFYPNRVLIKQLY